MKHNKDITAPVEELVDNNVSDYDQSITQQFENTATPEEERDNTDYNYILAFPSSFVQFEIAKMSMSERRVVAIP